MRRLNSISIQENDTKPKEPMSEIIKLLGEIDNTTNNLDDKLGAVLKLKELEFVNSYRKHMASIKSEVLTLQTEIELKDKRIRFLEQQGTTAQLLKRIKLLESSEQKLLESLNKKMAHIKQLMIDKQICKSEQKRLEERVKQLLRNRAKSLCQITHHPETHKSVQTFSTEISPEYESTLARKLFEQNSKAISRRKQALTIERPNPEKSSHEQITKLKQRIDQIQIQNKKLTKANSKLIIQLEQYEEDQLVLLRISAHLQKDVQVYKLLKQCVTQELKKQEKMQLLAKIFSIDEVLVLLCNRVHRKLCQKNIIAIPIYNSIRDSRLIAKTRLPSFRDTRLV